jgi:ribosomal protein L11 methyltransferase
MPWLALAVDVERGAADAFSDALLQAGAQSVFLDSGGVRALLALTDSPEAIIAAAAAHAGIAPPSYRAERVEDQDWVRASQAQFEALAIGKRLWIGANWHEAPPGRVVVRIDPGLAFGTGSHASTRLVLRFLEAAVRGGERILDYGCGSGILAIAAAKLGAAHVDAVDVDPQAVETTLANARANGISMNATLPDALTDSEYDLVLANILAQPLIVLAPLLAQRGRRIVLSGILEAQADEVARAYAPWYGMSVPRCEEGWALLVGERR